MVWQISSKSRSIIATMTVFRPFSVEGGPFRFSRHPAITNLFMAFHRHWPSFRTEKLRRVSDSWSGSSTSLKQNPAVRFNASTSSIGLAQELTSLKAQSIAKAGSGLDLFDELKQRFLSFKKQKYLEEVEYFQTLAEAQAPKFMVIACVDSRVCPSNILGFQPGEAFMIRNVANLVPPLENGPTETNAALEFAVNTLQVQNILVIGHSSCAGIQALMTMQDRENSSFIEKWVANAKAAKTRTEEDATHVSFHQQCKHCEKESINCSLLNLLTYPWIEDKLRKGLLSLHGGYYDFSNCTFEKWTLDFGSNYGTISFKDRVFWC